VLLGYIEVLREEDDDAPGGQPREIIDRMHRNIHDLAATVENLMEFAQSQASAEAAAEEDVELRGFMAEMMPGLEAANRSKHLDLKVDLAAAPEAIRVRRRAFKSIVSNLVSNAVKFTPAGSVTIAMRKTEPNGHVAVELEVADTGPGIDPEFLDRAFERFT